MRIIKTLAFVTLMAVLPCQASAQGQAVATFSSGALAQAEQPPFCTWCELYFFSQQPYQCYGWICNMGDAGFYHCDAYFYGCGDSGCIEWGAGCEYQFEDFAADGSIRAPGLRGLSDEAVAAVLDADADDTTLRRRCDEGVVVRRVAATIAVDQRRRTARITI